MCEGVVDLKRYCILEEEWFKFDQVVEAKDDF